MKLDLVAGLIWATLLRHSEGKPASPRAEECLCLPGDACWPSQNTWSALNSTVNGKLVATIPIGSPCHDPTFDGDACENLKAQWLNPLTQ
jgi:hypothetical protein